MNSRRRLNSPAFTLIELVLVLALIAVIVGMSTTSLGRFGRGRGLGDSADQVVMLARWARSQAISRGINFRLNFDTTQRTYWLTMQTGANYENVVNDASTLTASSNTSTTVLPQTDTFDQVGEEFGRHFTLGDGIDLTCNFAAQNDGQYIEFRPTGHCDPATVRLTEKSSPSIIEVGCLSATEQWHVLSDDERQLEASLPPPPAAQVR